MELWSNSTHLCMPALLPHHFILGRGGNKLNVILTEEGSKLVVVVRKSHVDLGVGLQILILLLFGKLT